MLSMFQIVNGPSGPNAARLADKASKQEASQFPMKKEANVALAQGVDAVI